MATGGSDRLVAPDTLSRGDPASAVDRRERGEIRGGSPLLVDITVIMGVLSERRRTSTLRGPFLLIGPRDGRSGMIGR